MLRVRKFPDGADHGDARENKEAAQDLKNQADWERTDLRVETWVLFLEVRSPDKLSMTPLVLTAWQLENRELNGLSCLAPSRWTSVSTVKTMLAPQPWLIVPGLLSYADFREGGQKGGQPIQSEARETYVTPRSAPWNHQHHHRRRRHQLSCGKKNFLLSSIFSLLSLSGEKESEEQC